MTTIESFAPGDPAIIEDPLTIIDGAQAVVIDPTLDHRGACFCVAHVVFQLASGKSQAVLVRGYWRVRPLRPDEAFSLFFERAR